MEQIGRYKITKELGRGAMGVIYAATDHLIGRSVAIKTIRLSSLDSGDNHDELTKRLYREAQSAGILSHPGIITIYDIGEQGEDAYIVMEFVAGRPLEDLLASDSPEHAEKYFPILRQTADALDYAHGKGIIHRDVKPSNIMICEDGRVKVADFGIAKLTASASMTQSGFVLGTPSYMSPEQAQGREVDGRSDQFSLAVVAYRILTGSLPFVASTLTGLLAKILWEEPDYDKSGFRPSLLAVFKKALSKDPQNRFDNCLDFVQALEIAFVQRKDRESISASPTAPPRIEPSANPAARKKISSTAWLATIAAAVLLGILLFAMKSIHNPEVPAPGQPPAASEGASTVGTTAAPEPIPAARPLTTTASAPVQPVLSEKQELRNETDRPGTAVTQPVSFAQSAAALKPSKPAPKRAQPAQLNSGTIIWTGELQKNSVLILEDQQASIGAIEGQFPGRPISIEVDPKEVVIRQLPNATNGWKLIILYSGNQKYTSITINWKAAP